MPVLFNTRDEVIRCQHGGMYTSFKPGEKKDIFDSYAAKHMLNRWGKDGLIELNFGPKESAQFDDFDEYEHSQKIVGLTRYLQTLELAHYNFQAYDEACGDKKSIERRGFSQNAKELEKKINGLKSLLEKLEGQNVRKTPQEKAAVLMQKAKQLEMEAKRLLKDTHGDNPARPT